MASSRVWVVGVTLVALLLSLDAQAQKLSSPPPPKAASPPLPPSPPPPSPPPHSPPPPAAPPAKSGTVDIRNRIGNGPVQFAYQVGTVTYFAYTDGGSGVGVTTDKNFPGTWWQLGFDSSTPNAVTIWNAYGVAYLSNNRDSQVMDTTQAYALRIWWYFYEVGTTGTYRIGNALGKQVTNEFFSFNGVYTLEGATAWGIAGITNNAIPPVGTVDIRDKVGTGPIQLTYLAGTTTYYAYASGEGVAVTTDKTYPGTWWRVGNFDAGPTRNAVTLYHSYTQSNLTNNRDIQVVNVNKNYNTRVWWYFYSSDVNGTYKIGNVQGKQVHKEFFSFSGYYTQDYATAWRIDGVTWDVPPPAGTVDIRNRVGTGPIQLAYDSGSVTYYAYANSPGVSITTDKNYPGTWFQVGFGTGPTNAVTLFNSYSNGFLASNRDDQVIDTTNIYQTRIWWWFYEESAGSNTYKIGNILGKQISKEFFSFRSPYTLEGATAFRIVQSTWSATLHGASEVANSNYPLPLDLDLQALHLRGAV